jgi:hypothetical protein
MAALGAPLPGTTSGGARWTTLDYPEKVRPQFLSLRQQVIDIAEIIVVVSIRATFPTVSVSIRANSKLRARITPDSSEERGGFSERHFSSTVLFAMIVRFRLSELSIS